MEKQEQEKKGLDILLVEDNMADIKISLRAFQNMGFQDEIYIVNDGQEALDFVYNRGEYKDLRKYPQPNIILLDVNMPKVDGFEVLEQLKSDKKYAKIPVIILTSSKNEYDVERAYGFGASGYIQKPVGYDDFVKIVKIFSAYWHEANKLPRK